MPLKIHTIILLSFVLAGCHFRGDLLPVHTGLEGSWRYQCVPDLYPPYGSIRQIKFYLGNKIVQNLTSYKGEHCEYPLINTNIMGHFTLGETVDKGSFDEHTKIDSSGHQVVVTILDANTVYEANNRQLGDFGFGITNWKKDEPRVLTDNKLAIKYYLLGKPLLDIYKIETNKLFYGDQAGNRDADGRPIMLDRNVWGTHE